MAAVLCLIMLPLMAAIGFMLGVVHGEWSGASLLAGVTFLLLGGGLLVGAFRVAQGWDEHEEH